MITITHFGDGRKTNHPYTKRGNAEYCYAVGASLPNYPVPATLTTTAYNHFHDPEHWWHWEWTKRRLFHNVSGRV